MTSGLTSWSPSFLYCKKGINISFTRWPPHQLEQEKGPDEEADAGWETTYSLNLYIQGAYYMQAPCRVLGIQR